jgi:membrane protease YdiL (CAAX protease family)
VPAPVGWPLVAWLVILAAVVFLVWRTAVKPPGSSPQMQGVVVSIQGRYLIGAGELLGDKGKEDLFKQAQQFQRGPIVQRLGFAVITAELKGLADACDDLAQLEKQVEPKDSGATDRERTLTEALASIYRTAAQGRSVTLTEDEQAQVRQTLGWLGRLALATGEGPDSPARQALLAEARRTALVLLVAGGSILLLLLVGLFLLVLFVVLWLTRHLQTRLVVEGPGGVYVEAFALWMVVYFALGYLLRFLPPTRFGMLLQGLIMLLSLAAALAWPVLRGIPRSRMAREIGLQAGPHPLREVLSGIACWIGALPLVGLGLLLTLGLMRLQQALRGGVPLGPTDMPTHPIAGEVAEGGWAIRAQVFVLAAVVAPLVEETMFRGFLYRHVRGKFGPLLAAVVVSFLFAVIHPQGVVAVPVLMALAIAFSLVREWRGSLLPGMVAHGVHNGLVTLLLIAMAG